MKHYFLNHLQRNAVATDGGGGAGAATDDKRTETELLEKIQQRIDNSLATRATKEELAAIKNAQIEELKGFPIEALRSMADDKTGVMAKLAAQGFEITKLQQAAKNNQVEDLSTRGQVAKWHDANKDAIKQISEGHKVNLPQLELRVASPMLPSTVNSTASPYIGRVDVAPGIGDFLRQQPTFWDLLTKGRTSYPTYVWVNKANPLGAAAWIGPGVPKPGVSFELVAETSNAKKIADSAKAATELLQDIDGMTSFIEDELRYQVMIKVNSTLLNSVATSTVPGGIRQVSTTYTLTSIKTANPNYMDALRAVVAALRAGFINGEVTLIINPIDAANMDLAKASTSGVYLLPPFVTSDGRTISGARVVEDNGVPVGSVQAGFLRNFRILVYKPFTVAWGWENDDFTRNLVTAVGEMRLHQFVDSRYTGGFIFDTFAHIIGLLTVAP